MLFAGGYWVARLVMWGSVQKLPHRHGFVSFTVGAFVTGLLMVLGALLPEHLRVLVWALASLVDLGVPYWCATACRTCRWTPATSRSATPPS